MFFGFFLVVFVHFLNVFLVQHIIFESFAPAFLDQKQGHGDEKKPKGPPPDEFVPGGGGLFQAGEAIDDSGQGGQGNQEDDVFEPYFHYAYWVKLINFLR